MSKSGERVRSVRTRHDLRWLNSQPGAVMGDKGRLVNIRESRVRYYSRVFPATFRSGSGALLEDEEGREYLDFFCGAGTLSYGHNHPDIKRRVIEYLDHDGVVHALDMATSARREMLELFHATILAPRNLPYKIQLPAPTGADCVEAAIKLVRKATGRRQIVSFNGAYHGVTLGTLSVTDDTKRRAAAGVSARDTMCWPYSTDVSDPHESLDQLEQVQRAARLTGDHAAAFLVETIQAEGGVRVADPLWLRGLAEIAARHGILLIVDDIQVGCGRTGRFFSFEHLGIAPDVVCLSKAIGGLGLPMSMLLLNPEIDVWAPGEHVGTFRGNNLAFVAASAALMIWGDVAFQGAMAARSLSMSQQLERVVARHDAIVCEVRGRGFIRGIVFRDKGAARRVQGEAFRRRVLVEVVGAEANVLKCLPPLTISDTELQEGISRISDAIEAVTR